MGTLRRPGGRDREHDRAASRCGPRRVRAQPRREVRRAPVKEAILRARQPARVPVAIGTGQRAEMRPPAAANDRLETPASRARPLQRDADNGRRGGREKEKVELLNAALARWRALAWK